jgi:hypothetical protein
VAVWLWAIELHELGFRRKSEGYWQCQGRFGLPETAHLSVFAGNEQTFPGDRRGRRRLVEVSTFHITFEIGRENIHFYYHERLENEWEPGGHTSAAEIRHLGQDPGKLRGRADEVAAQLVASLLGRYHAREG